MRKYRIYQKYFFILFFIFFAIDSFPQTKIEAGPLAGISWYNGDLNSQQLFYKVHPSLRGIIRYSLNDRIAFRGGLQYVKISGSYPSSLNGIHLRSLSDDPYSFKRNVGDFSTLMEINFFSFDHPHNPASIFTPYIAFGLGAIYYDSYKEVSNNNGKKSTIILSLPFGIGVKWKANNWLNLGADWSFRKTFADDLDLVGSNTPVDPSDPFGFDESKLTHNNDWISVFGIYATFNIFSKREKCYDGFHDSGRN